MPGFAFFNVKSLIKLFLEQNIYMLFFNSKLMSISRIYHVGQYQEGDVDTFVIGRSDGPDERLRVANSMFSWPEFRGYLRAISNEIPSDVVDKEYRNWDKSKIPGVDIFDSVGVDRIHPVEGKYLEELARYLVIIK